MKILEDKLGYQEHEPTQHISLSISNSLKLDELTVNASGFENSFRKTTLMNLSKFKPKEEQNSFQEYFETLIFVTLFNIVKLLEPFVELMLREANRVQRLALNLSYNEK